MPPREDEGRQHVVDAAQVPPLDRDAVDVVDERRLDHEAVDVAAGDTDVDGEVLAVRARQQREILGTRALLPMRPVDWI